MPLFHLVVLLSLLLTLLPLCSFAPGFYFVRKFAWSPMEKLCASVGLSIVLLYLAAWALFWVGLPAIMCAGVSVVSFGLALAARKEIGALWRVTPVRRAVAGYAFLFGWALLMLAIIRNYNGFGWGGDWLEHFQRTLFFLHRFPASTPIVYGYLLPARPPLENMVAGFFLAQTGDRFEIFQVVFSFYNMLLFLPCCLLLPAMGMTRRPRVLPLVALFASSPVVMETATYSWTKSLAAFFVLLSVALYLAALRKHSQSRMAAAFVAAAAGLLAHYLAGPYLLFLAMHYLLFVFWKRREKWVELALAAGLGALLLMTWFGWSLAAYGADGTFQSNTSVTSAQKYQGNSFVKIAGNLYDTAIPVQIRTRKLLWGWQPNPVGMVRDNAFSIYQTNMIFGMGAIGGPVALWLLIRRRRIKEMKFWRALIAFAVLVGVAVVGERDQYGVAHLTLLPVLALGISMVAASFPWGLPQRRAAAFLLLAGCAVDFGMGVMLQMHVEGLENTTSRSIFTATLNSSNAEWQPGSPGPEALSVAVWENWWAKHRFRMTQRMLANIEGNPAKAGMAEKLRKDMLDDASLWGGWWRRHDYKMSFLGDDISQDSTTVRTWLEGLAAAIFMGLMAALWRELNPRARLVPAVGQASAPPAAKSAKKARGGS